ARETSPYLLQHADNPVDWYAWGDEAFARAREEDKPILLSVGYSACHWCHVMEHESFEDETTAKLMNELFVNVKVDREERQRFDGRTTRAGAASATRPSSRRRRLSSSCCAAVRSRWRSGRSTACGRAGCTTWSAAAFIATRWTSGGSCRISRRCSTTTRCSY